MSLTPEERQSLLAEPHIGALSVSAGPDRGPLTVPIWYQYTPGGDLWVATGPESAKMRRIRDAGRFSLMVQRVQPTVRYVSVEGPVTAVEPLPDARHREMVSRYLPPDQVEGYLAFAAAELGEHVMVRMRPERWLSADLG
ncbi:MULTISPECIES: pyridoxamine 5'-phosphate oxidase family protein [Nocardia]|uniref:pyridoxamine 5'-phosphate oxidase family protein n=1 Tax=Nocardia TaxID=1817 RepID=UPI0018955296|nr:MULTISPECIES: pyridoxamine 5'-phosphate oxidase family protein [Nocardia]MBF6347782.1 pyridoxamine 5'-phosphate oxidase family protein [Nocardia flavorosea]